MGERRMTLADSSIANTQKINPQRYDAQSLAAAIEQRFRIGGFTVGK